MRTSNRHISTYLLGIVFVYLFVCFFFDRIGGLHRAPVALERPHSNHRGRICRVSDPSRGSHWPRIGRYDGGRIGRDGPGGQRQPRRTGPGPHDVRRPTPLAGAAGGVGQSAEYRPVARSPGGRSLR